MVKFCFHVNTFEDLNNGLVIDDLLFRLLIERGMAR